MVRSVSETSRFSIIKDAEIGEGTKVHDHFNIYKCKIGKNCKIDAYVYIEEDVEIGDNCKIDAFVYVEEGVVIGDYCKIRPFVLIPTGVIIEDDVFVAPNVAFTNDKCSKAQGE